MKIIIGNRCYENVSSAIAGGICSDANGRPVLFTCSHNCGEVELKAIMAAVEAAVAKAVSDKARIVDSE